MSSVESVTTTSWPTTVIESKIPVLVDFWASWCQPCMRMAPILDEIAADYEGLVRVVKVNVDEERTLAGLYQIMGIPAFLMFKDGKKVDEVSGMMPKVELAKRIDKLL